MSSKEDNLVTIYINEIPLQVSKGLNLIEAAALAHKEIPYYCYHPKLSVAGNCRMCLVEMGMPMRDRTTGGPILDEKGVPKIGWMPKPVIGCATQVAEGMHVKTTSPLVKDCQKGVMEMLLINHPLDCPICDQAGECRLQEFATDYGRGYSRFVENKVVKPKRTILGPRVMLDDERCILCSRCIRFCKEIVGEDVLGFVDRGSYSTLTCYPGKQLENNYSLNTVDICPVGALTSLDFRFKMRVWFLKRTKSICTESSVGVNTEVYSREGKIYRITPRRNDFVNDTWMADSGRALYKIVEDPKRIKNAECTRNVISSAEAQIRFSEVLKTGKTAYLGSSFKSLEEQYLFKKIVHLTQGSVYWLSHYSEGDGILISKDRTPNMRGALVLGLINALPENNLEILKNEIHSGAIKNLVVYHEDLTQYGFTEAELKKVNTIYLGTHRNATSDLAYLVIPTLTVFEKSGTFINQQFRLQKFEQAIPGPTDTPSDVNTLNRVLTLYEGKNDTVCSLPLIWNDLRKESKLLENIYFEKIPDQGVLIDAKPFEMFDFVEEKTLHFEPKLKKALN